MNKSAKIPKEFWSKVFCSFYSRCYIWEDKPNNVKGIAAPYGHCKDCPAFIECVKEPAIGPAFTEGVCFSWTKRYLKDTDKYLKELLYGEE